MLHDFSAQKVSACLLLGSKSRLRGMKEKIHCAVCLMNYIMSSAAIIKYAMNYRGAIKIYREMEIWLNGWRCLDSHKNMNYSIELDLNSFVWLRLRLNHEDCVKTKLWPRWLFMKFLVFTGAWFIREFAYSHGNAYKLVSMELFGAFKGKIMLSVYPWIEAFW